MSMIDILRSTHHRELLEEKYPEMDQLCGICKHIKIARSAPYASEPCVHRRAAHAWFKDGAQESVRQPVSWLTQVVILLAAVGEAVLVVARESSG